MAACLSFQHSALILTCVFHFSQALQDMPPQWRQLQLTEFCFRFNRRQPCTAQHGHFTASIASPSPPVTISSDSPQRMPSSVEGIKLLSSHCSVCEALWSLLELPDRIAFQSTSFFHSDIRWYTAAWHSPLHLLSRLNPKSLPWTVASTHQMMVKSFAALRWTAKMKPSTASCPASRVRPRPHLQTLLASIFLLPRDS